MASSPIVPPAGGAGRIRFFGKTRFVLLVVLLALLVLCIILSFVTQGAMAYLNQRVSAPGSAAQSLVDVQPWQTAQSLASLAVSAEEQEYAHEALRLADHQVDQAFAAALRQARLDARTTTLPGNAQALVQKVAQLEQLRQQDQALVDRLSAKAGEHKTPAANSAQPSAGTSDLDVAKAQLALDTDELADMQRALARASGDHTEQIQQELAAHEASMKKYDNQAAGDGQLAVLSAAQNHTLAMRIGAWFKQRQREELIEQAQQDAQNDARNLTAERSALDAKANAAAAPGATPDQAGQLAYLKDRSTERQILSIDDDRIQTAQLLANVYGKWSAQVKLQHRIVLHLILRSLAVILVILLGMLVCDALIRYLIARLKIESRRLRTLRSVLEIGVQALGVVLILLVVFGAPQETPTILGLATAALTIALQDYILAFLGWFVLVGNKGIHVGDWVEINGVNGEVVEIGLMTTTLLETGGLADQGHLTGRRISFMNGYAIRGQYFNFSTAGQWMWDEMTVSVPAGADMNSLMEEVRNAVAEETRENSQQAEQEWKHVAHGEAPSQYSTKPVVNVRPSGSGVELYLRYVTSASGRFDLRNRLYQRVVDLLHAKVAASA